MQSSLIRAVAARSNVVFAVTSRSYNGSKNACPIISTVKRRQRCSASIATTTDHNHQQQKRWHSSSGGGEGEAVAVAKKGEGEEEEVELTFSSPRVKALYERMIKLEKDEVSMVGRMIHDILDIEVAPNEFYYYGIGSYGGGGGGGKGGAAAEEAVEEVKKDTFDLKLVGFDDKSKIKVIKEVRAVAGLGLKEAKEMVEGAPKVVMKDINKEMAEELKEKLEAVGAQIELV